MSVGFCNSMKSGSSISQQFILQTFDRERWCPVLQAMFEVGDPKALRAILGELCADDPELDGEYVVNEQDLAAISTQFSVNLNNESLKLSNIESSIFKRTQSGLLPLPYLVHAGYELPLMLDGRKKLAKMYHEYPPLTFAGEEIFDRWVQMGRLHKEVEKEPFDDPVSGFEGLRTAYYTSKGEEWRIPAMKLIWKAAGKAGGWNEHFERLEGMLFGYEDWQNDWWIEKGLEAGRFAGMPLCCAVNAAELAWIEAAGFRALPPIDQPSLAIMSADGHSKVEMKAFMLHDADSVALVRFNLFGKVLTEILDIRQRGPWLFPSDRIPELNRSLLRSIVVIDKRAGD